MGSKYEELREEAGLTYDEVASGTGMSKALAYFISKGTKNPSVATIKKLCDFYSVSSDYLLFGSGCVIVHIVGSKETDEVPYWFYEKARKDKEAKISFSHPYNKIERTMTGKSAERWEAMRKIGRMSEAEMKTIYAYLETRAEAKERK